MKELKIALLVVLIETMELVGHFRIIVNRTAGGAVWSQRSEGVELARYSAPLRGDNHQIDCRLVLKDRPQKLLFVVPTVVDVRQDD